MPFFLWAEFVYIARKIDYYTRCVLISKLSCSLARFFGMYTSLVAGADLIIERLDEFFKTAAAASQEKVFIPQEDCSREFINF